MRGLSDNRVVGDASQIALPIEDRVEVSSDSPPNLKVPLAGNPLRNRLVT